MWKEKENIKLISPPAMVHTPKSSEIRAERKLSTEMFTCGYQQTVLPSCVNFKEVTIINQLLLLHRNVSRRHHACYHYRKKLT